MIAAFVLMERLIPTTKVTLKGHIVVSLNVCNSKLLFSKEVI
jgi:hypothetical protein